MHILSVKLVFNIPHAMSLKDKRRVCRSIIEKTRKKFNVSIAEVASQDKHQILTIGVVVISGEMAHARRSLDEVIRYMDGNTDAELIEIE